MGKDLLELSILLHALLTLGAHVGDLGGVGDLLLAVDLLDALLHAEGDRTHEEREHHKRGDHDEGRPVDDCEHLAARGEDQRLLVRCLAEPPPARRRREVSLVGITAVERDVPARGGIACGRS